jgi:hypothetical protein
LHSPMQALKQAAKEGDAARIEAIRETFALRAEPVVDEPAAETVVSEVEKVGL